MHTVAPKKNELTKARIRLACNCTLWACALQARKVSDERRRKEEAPFNEEKRILKSLYSLAVAAVALLSAGEFPERSRATHRAECQDNNVAARLAAAAKDNHAPGIARFPVR